MMLDSEVKARYKICEQCEFFTSLKFCSKCNCYMPLKTKFPSKTCPIDKWGRIIINTVSENDK